ncbi:helix-turn-helix domain-containing protein [bacterium]|nr:helix-turn-helix domain-containing protein [bacterium]
MNEPTPGMLLEVPEIHRPGQVSARCRFVDDGDQRFVLVDEQPAYCYHLSDKVAARQTWTQVYINGLATYREIAGPTEFCERSIQYWVARYRAEGAAGLVDLPRSGAPRKVTTKVRSKIYRLRDQRRSINEIAQGCGISVSTVEKVLQQRREALEKRQGKLTAVIDSEATTAATDLPEPPEAATDRSPCEQLTTSAPAPDSPAELAPEQASDASNAPVADCIEAAMAVDRREDRLLARLGELSDAEPLFAPCERLDWAGAFLAVAVLAEDPFLRLGQRFYRPFPAAFYGVRTMLVTLMLMALLRIKRPEHLRRHNVQKLGRVLGLDRAPEVKTLRRQLHGLEQQGGATELMGQIARERVGEYEGPVRIVHVDGHMAAYSGARKIGTVYDPRAHQVSKGHTTTWANLPGSCPLFAVQSEFNDGLTRALPEVLAEARRVTGVKHLCCAFDRGGYNVLLFERLIADGYDILTYRRGAYEPVPEAAFERRTTIINDREYDFAPYETVAQLRVYEPVDRGPGKKPGYRDTKRRLHLREIRILRPDGKQTAILTSVRAEEDCSVELAAALFDRIGSQENIFKYMRVEFDLDALPTYGDEELDEELHHPHPAYVGLQKEADRLRRQRARLLGKYADVLTDEDEEAAGDTLRQLRQTETEIPEGKPDDAAKLADFNRRLAEVKSLLVETPARERLSEAGYRQLKTELRQLTNTVKISAYHIETKLVELLVPHYANGEDEARVVIAAALRSAGGWRGGRGGMGTQLDRQAERGRAGASSEVAGEWARRGVRCPGSRGVIVCPPAPPPPPLPPREL